jgi:hypothetical protein
VASDGPFDRRIGMDEQGSEYDGPLRWLRPNTSGGSSDFKSDELANERPSTGRRMLRAVVRSSFVFLIRVGTTLGWQSYHGEAKELVGTWVPSLSWVLARASGTADTSSELGHSIDRRRPSPYRLRVTVCRARPAHAIRSDNGVPLRQSQRLAQTLAASSRSGNR